MFSLFNFFFLSAPLYLYGEGDRKGKNISICGPKIFVAGYGSTENCLGCFLSAQPLRERDVGDLHAEREREMWVHLGSQALHNHAKSSGASKHLPTLSSR